MSVGEHGPPLHRTPAQSASPPAPALAGGVLLACGEHGSTGTVHRCGWRADANTVSVPVLVLPLGKKIDVGGEKGWGGGRNQTKASREIVIVARPRLPPDTHIRTNQPPITGAGWGSD